MPKYWGKQIFSHGSFPKVGQKQKTEKKVGNIKGQLRIATPPRVAHAKPPGPILGETNFQPREIHQSGSKAKDGKERERKREKYSRD